jgi:hypothetical protein
MQLNRHNMNEWIIIIDLTVSWQVDHGELRDALWQAGFAVIGPLIASNNHNLMTLTYHATHASEHAMVMFVLAKGNDCRAFKYKKVAYNHE